METKRWKEWWDWQVEHMRGPIKPDPAIGEVKLLTRDDEQLKLDITP
jgi:hypothetical protein